MREELANLVHPVFSYALNLRDRLEMGEQLKIEGEQMALRGLLLAELEAQRFPEFGGDDQAPRRGARGLEDGGAVVTAGFLGARYALVCWLDELFVLASSWSEEWNSRKLEAALYGSNDRAWKFWEQALLAESRPTLDALEVFYLCVMMGFRGELREGPDKLKAWTAGVQARLTNKQAAEWPHPPELEPPTNVPPLRGRERLQRVVWLCGAALLVLIPIVAFFVVQQMGH